MRFINTHSFVHFPSVTFVVLTADQLRPISIYLNSFNLTQKTRLRGITKEFVEVFFSRNLVLRSIVLGCILIFQNWAIFAQVVLVCILFTE